MKVKVKLLQQLRSIVLLSCVVLIGWTSQSITPRSVDVDELPDSCNFVEHLKCINLTGKETIEDSYEGKYTRYRC